MFKINFSLLDKMERQIKQLNVTYIPVMDNYPQYENVSNQSLDSGLRTKVAGKFEKGEHIDFCLKEELPRDLA